MGLTQTVRQPVEDRSRIAEARRTVAAVGAEQHFDVEDHSRLALVVTELCTNLIAHAGGGELLVRGLFADDGTADGVEVVAIDRGPGLGGLADALRDGFSTLSTPGNGLGAVVRAAQGFDVHTEPGRGTAVLARLARGARSPGPRPHGGVVNVCHPGEEVCGDSWLLEHQAERTLVLVADGLGHGPGAARASRAAVARVEGRSAPPDVLLEEAHVELKGTRGAAIGVAELLADGRVRFAGVGNVAATVVTPEGQTGCMSLPGIVGSRMQDLFVDERSAPPGSLLVLHSDGCRTDWSLADHPGLAQRDPALVAAVLFRDHARPDDDVTIVAVRSPAPEGP